jgi:hypothetical protein
MSLKFNSDFYTLSNPKRYIGTNTPRYRSGWELTVMRFLDNHPSVQQWANESVKIPYRDPLTGKHTVYVPDFLVQYIDKDHNTHLELWEIKPAKHTLLEKVGKNPYDQAQFIKNQAKWAAANHWAGKNNIRFRIINEGDIFHTGKKKK